MEDRSMNPGPLIIVSGPSGTGKSTLIHTVLQRETAIPLRLAISATTREARPGEKDGVAYHFWARERFESQLREGAFLEHAIVHGKNYYGTPRSEVDPWRQQGFGVILDIDVQGAAQVRQVYPEHLSIFVALSRWEMYEQRLQTAKVELDRVAEYQHIVNNDDLETAITQFRALLASYLKKEQRNPS
jgi:guanylate kinase